MFKKIYGISSTKGIFLTKIDRVGVRIKTEPTYRCDNPSKVDATMMKSETKTNKRDAHSLLVLDLQSKVKKEKRQLCANSLIW